MADNVTTQIESKTRVSRHINLSSLYFIVGYLMFAYMLKDFIYSLFFVPYMIFSLCCAVYLVLPSRYNKGRANWESIVVLLEALGTVIRVLFGAVFSIALMAIAMLALLYDNTRELLLQNLQQLWQEICSMLGIGG